MEEVTECKCENCECDCENCDCQQESGHCAKCGCGENNENP